MAGRLTTFDNYGPLGLLAPAELAPLVAAPRLASLGTEIVSEEGPSKDCHLLVAGQAYRHRTLADGRRQIMSFNVPGDLLDLQGLSLDLDFGVTALSNCRVVAIPKAKLQALIDEHLTFRQAIWRSSLVEAAIFREWMVGMGRRSAQARIAHLLCEVYMRHRAVGLTSGRNCYFPVTQTHLADALGLSSVHTNRVLQALRADGLIAYRGRELVIRDWPGLCAAGEFDPAYLHLPERLAA